MKHILVLLVMALMGAPAMAEDYDEPERPLPLPEEPAPAPGQDLLGEWLTERPTQINPRAVSYGRVIFSEQKVVYEATCSYEYGPVLKASVESEVEYSEGRFFILETKRTVNFEQGYSCEAYLGRSAVHYRTVDNRLQLYSRHGWRMTLVRR
jgi:hypothetical protein